MKSNWEDEINARSEEGDWKRKADQEDRVELSLEAEKGGIEDPPEE